MRNRSTDSNPIDFQHYPATLVGLQMVRAACRNQMMRIVKEACKACNSVFIEQVLDELYLSCANAFTDLIPIQVDNLKRNPALALPPDSCDIIPPVNLPIFASSMYTLTNIPEFCPYPFQVAIPIYESHTEEWIEACRELLAHR